MSNMTFGEWLRREIENRLLTVAQFADEAKLSRDAIYKFIKGEPPSGLSIAKLAHGLGVPREEIEERLSANSLKRAG
jgi:transcriptional regulator with XRE-family HTH domain